jgi:hypothetical protein
MPVPWASLKTLDICLNVMIGYTNVANVNVNADDVNVNINNVNVNTGDVNVNISNKSADMSAQGVCMGGHADWIPRRETELVELMMFWLLKLADAALQTAYSWLAEECTLVNASLQAFLDARAAYQTTPTTANRIAKEEARNAAVEAMRKFARERIRNNPALNDGQKHELGVAVSDREPSPVVAPDEGPDSDAEISAKAPGVVKVRYFGAKPYGVDRVEIAWALSDTPIDSPDQLANNETFSRNPWQHTFGHADRGRRLFYSLRYLTKEGASHWSDVREVIIP